MQASFFMSTWGNSSALFWKRRHQPSCKTRCYRWVQFQKIFTPTLHSTMMGHSSFVLVKTFVRIYLSFECPDCFQCIGMPNVISRNNLPSTIRLTICHFFTHCLSELIAFWLFQDLSKSTCFIINIGHARHWIKNEFVKNLREEQRASSLLSIHCRTTIENSINISETFDQIFQMHSWIWWASFFIY